MPIDLPGSAASILQFANPIVRERSGTECTETTVAQPPAEGIAQSAFTTYAPRIGKGCYNTPDGDELWKLLLVVAAQQIRGKAADHQAAKRDSHRSIRRAKAQTHLELKVDVQESSYAYLEMLIEEILERLPPQNRVMVKLRLDGCAVVEVARLTARSRRSVERILRESHLKLGAFLQKED